MLSQAFRDNAAKARRKTPGFVTGGIDPAGTAHLIIDMQRQDCDPVHGSGCAETDAVIRTLRNNVLPACSGAGIPSFLIYTDYHGRGPSVAGGGLCGISEADGTPLPKSGFNSAFRGAQDANHDLAQMLRDRGITTVIISGVNASACIYETVKEALSEGFEVYVLKDCVANSQRISTSRTERLKYKEEYLGYMREAGAVAMKSATFKRLADAGHEQGHAPRIAARPGLNAPEI